MFYFIIVTKGRERKVIVLYLRTINCNLLKFIKDSNNKIFNPIINNLNYFIKLFKV